MRPIVKLAALALIIVAGVALSRLAYACLVTLAISLRELAGPARRSHR